MTAPSHRQLLRPLALLAAGMSGADIERLVRELRGRGRRRDDPDETPITWFDLERALLVGKNVPSSALARRIATHELGHAIAYETLKVAKVILVRVGGERGGETRTKMNVEVIQEERGMMGWMACLLAGQVAEKLLYGAALLGAGGTPDSDLARATSIAVDLETGYGVGTEMPILYRVPTNPSETLLYNPALAHRVNQRLDAAQAIAQTLLKERLHVLAALADHLAIEIVIDGERLRDTLKTNPNP